MILLTSHRFFVLTLLLIRTFTSATATYVAQFSSETTSTSTPAIPTPIYLDLIPSYSDLPDCAVAPLSNIVRNMWSGCGDGSQLTSFSCFCTDSYSRFSWEISTAVVGNCDDQNDAKEDLASSAVDVFHDYCVHGSEQLLTTTVDSGNGLGSGSNYGVVASIPASSTTTSTTDLTGAQTGVGNGLPVQTQQSFSAIAMRRSIPMIAVSSFSLVLGVNWW